MADYESLTITTTDHVAVIELCRPELLNRFDTILHEEFGRALQEVADHREVRVAILCASGTAFSAGGDTALMETAMTDFRSRLSLIDEGRCEPGGCLMRSIPGPPRKSNWLEPNPTRRSPGC